MKINKNDMDLKATILSGQSFRNFEREDGSFDIVLKDRVINVKENGEYIEVFSNKEKDLRKVVRNYFDLNRDYESLGKLLSKKDAYMKKIVKKNKGYKILRQDPEEMLVTYIISQNNQVKRIGTAVNMLSKKYGKKIKFNGEKYYLFPSLKRLKRLTYKQLRECGLGFRDKYVKDAVIHAYKNPEFLTDLKKMKAYEATESLMSLTGVGLKVSSCILLFGYGKLDVYPIDTWVTKNIKEHYTDVKPDMKHIKEYAQDTYGELCGLAIQYMFNAERNVK